MTTSDGTWRRTAIPVACGLLIGLLAGCAASPPVRLYVLAAEAGETIRAAPGLAVGVGPVTLAGHLDRPQIVTRSGHELRLGELDRWAEPLGEGIARVLAENLGALLGSERVWIHPWRPSQPVDLQVVLEVLRCDLEAGGEAVLAVRFMVFDRDGGMLAARHASFRETAADAASAPAALSRALAALSRELAGVLGGLGPE